MMNLSDLFFSVANAQEAAANAAQQQNPMTSMLFPMLLMFVVFYFLMIRPQKKKMQEEQNMLNKLTKGDEVYTKSGVFGTVTGLTDKVITLEISEGVKVKFLRGQIGGLASRLLAEKTESASKK